MLVAALLKSKGRVARFKVLKAMLLSAWAETRQEVHAVERYDRIGDMRSLIASGSLEGSSSSSSRWVCSSVSA
jgi:hypothetical protein